MNTAQYETFLTEAFKNMVSHSVSGAILFAFIDWRHIREMLTAADGAGCAIKNICVWVKSQPAMGSFYRSQHEFVVVLKHGNSPHRNNIQLGRFGRCRSNVWSYPGGSALARSRDEGNLLALHPTPKPVAMIADAILDCSARGDIVLDPFMGSGSTLIAAERIGRRCFGMELDPLYVDTTIRRWQGRSGKAAIHASSGRSFDEMQAKAGRQHAPQR